MRELPTGSVLRSDELCAHSRGGLRLWITRLTANNAEGMKSVTNSESTYHQFLHPRVSCYYESTRQDKKHLARVRRKIDRKELLALHAVYDETNIDELINFLESLNLIELGPGVLLRGKTVR